jgi:hypothetical protein
LKFFSIKIRKSLETKTYDRLSEYIIPRDELCGKLIIV